MWACLVGMVLSGSAHGAVHVVEEGQTSVVPLNTTAGTVIQLPGAVQLVTPTTHVVVERVGGAQANSSSSRQSKSKTPPLPVRHLRVSARAGAAPESELVTFVLADGTALAVQFVPGGEGADPFADLQFPKAAKVSVWGHGFLAEERELMTAMFADEPYRREILAEEWTYEAYPELRWELRRRFRGDGLTGYVFVLENLTKSTLHLDPSVLSVDAPNRAILTQLDHEQLASCSKEGVCRTVLRLVVRETHARGGQMPVSSAMPFVRVLPKKGKK